VLAFVDEVPRRREGLRPWPAQITALLARQGVRQYKLMEVCGGHTHTILQSTAIDDLPCPESITLGARARVARSA